MNKKTIFSILLTTIICSCMIFLTPSQKAYAYNGKEFKSIIRDCLRSDGYIQDGNKLIKNNENVWLDVEEGNYIQVNAELKNSTIVVIINNSFNIDELDLPVKGSIDDNYITILRLEDDKSVQYNIRYSPYMEYKEYFKQFKKGLNTVKEYNFPKEDTVLMNSSNELMNLSSVPTYAPIGDGGLPWTFAGAVFNRFYGKPKGDVEITMETYTQKYNGYTYYNVKSDIDFIPGRSISGYGGWDSDYVYINTVVKDPGNRIYKVGPKDAPKDDFQHVYVGITGQMKTLNVDYDMQLIPAITNFKISNPSTRESRLEWDIDDWSMYAENVFHLMPGATVYDSYNNSNFNLYLQIKYKVDHFFYAADYAVDEEYKITFVNGKNTNE